MTPIDDLILMAYADGELEPAERQRVDAELARDSALRERLALFAGTSALLAPLDQTLSEPLPPALARQHETLAAALSQRIQSTGNDARAARGAQAGESGRDQAAASGQAQARQAAREDARPAQRQDAASTRRDDRAGPLQAIRDWLFGSSFGFAAAAATFVLGGLIGLLAPMIWQAEAPAGGASNLASVDGDELPARALATMPAGTALEHTGESGRRSLTPLVSIRTAAGQYCREYVDVHSDASGSPAAGSPAAGSPAAGTPAARSARGRACRDDDGNWHLRVLVAQDVPLAPAGGGDGSYQPASGGLAECDALGEQLAPGDPLSDAEEAEAIDRGWQAH